MDGNTARVLSRSLYAAAFNVSLVMDHDGAFQGDQLVSSMESGSDTSSCLDIYVRVRLRKIRTRSTKYKAIAKGSHCM